jgi:peptide-methionine (S)-S-oxide reductase
MVEESHYEKATFAAGCFWGVEAEFQDVQGVISTQVGYTGGVTKHPTYEDVCRGDTDHAEAVELIFDPSTISYSELLDIFWRIHDPTLLNRQGPDVGSQYRSAIFYHNEQQHKHAIASRDMLQRTIPKNKPIVTQILSAPQFYPAEEYHQNYFKKHGRVGCPI